MDQDNKTPTGAPSSDTTSALFVSARKKQLEQQEAERAAREKEEQRLAAEAEVQRLEREVEERRLRAAEEARRVEEDAQRVEADAAMRRQQAEYEARRVEGEAQARRAMAEKEARRVAEAPQAMNTNAAAMPNAAPGGTWQQSYPQPMQQPAAPYAPVMGKPAAQGGSGGSSKNKKMLAFIGGGVVLAIALVVVLVVVLGGGSGEPTPPLPSTVSYNITGRYYYLEGLDHADSFYFYSDGTMEFYQVSTDRITIHDYYVAGNNIAVIGTVYGDNEYSLNIVNESRLVDKYDDAYITVAAISAPPPSQPTTSGWDITGYYFYLNGDTDEDSLWFFSDGTMEIYYRGSERTDTWDYGMDEDQITVFGELYSSSSPYTFTIIDQYTLVDWFNDSYIRSDRSSFSNPEPEPDTAWRVDPSAHLDSVAEVERLAMGMWYPSSQYDHEETEWGFQLSSVDGGSSDINVDIVLHAPGETTNNVRERIFGGYYSQLSNIDVIFNDHIDERGYGMFELTGDANGKSYYVCGVIGAWTNEQTGESNYYAAVLICPEAQSDDYFQLFWRIYESRHDS